MGARMRSHDWAATPLGPVETWPLPLLTMVSAVLSSPMLSTVLWGPDLIMLYNDAYAGSLADRHPHALGRPVAEVWGDAWQRVAPPFHRALAIGEGFAQSNIELPMVRRGKPEITHWNFTATPIRGEGGLILGLLNQGVEVTDSVRNETARRESEERLRLVVDGAKDHAILTTDPAGLITSWSAGAEVTFGWSADEIVGQSAELIFTPEDRAAGVPARELWTAAHKGCANDERWHLAKDGRRVFMNGAVHPLPRDEQDRERGFIKIARDETARRQADEALRVSEALARLNGERVQLALAAGAIIGTWHWDLPSDRFTVDEAFARSFGLDPALGREGIPLAQIVATVHPDDQAGLAAAIGEAIERGGAYAHQYRTLRRDGNYYWLEANGRVDHGPDGTPLSFPGVLLDMHERRAVEEERDRATTVLRERETRLRLAIDAGHIGEWELDLATNTSIRALQHDQIFGYDEPIENWGLDTFLGHVLPEDRAATEKAFNRAADTGGGWNFQCRIRRAGDDAVRLIAASSAPQLDGGGRTVKLFGMVQDITEQKTAELSLRELNEQLKAENLTRVRELNRMWAVTRDPLAISDLQGRLVAVNPAWTEVLGWTEAELLGATSEWLEHPDDKQKTRSETVSLSEGKPSFAFDHRLRTKGGDYRALVWACVPEGDYIYCSARDVTEERARAAELAG